MKKKKVNPADLDITPKEMGASEFFTQQQVKGTPNETNDLHCTPTQLNVCVSGLDCMESNYGLCEDETKKECDRTLACQETNVGCVDSKSAAVICCAHTGNDCLESGAACPGTYKNCPTDKFCDTNGCYSTEVGCPTDTVPPNCVATYSGCNTVICGEATADSPCIYTEQDTCENTVGIACIETLRNCWITYEDGCVTPVVTKEECVVSEECALTEVGCTILQTYACQETISNVCEETSSGCEE